MPYHAILDQVKTDFLHCLGGNLLGIYVHGSIALGCFSWARSDIDFIAVVKNPLSRAEKLALLAGLEALFHSAPPKGIEMSVVLLAHCQTFVYPTPYELHYSPSCRAPYWADPLSLCGEAVKCDPDLAAHFTIIRHGGLVLWGAPIDQVFQPVPPETYWDSIMADSRDACTGLKTDPVYVILNLCRVLAYQREGLVLSKAQGGRWGLSRLPEVFYPVIDTALSSYESGFGHVDSDLALALCRHALGHMEEGLLWT